MISEQQVEANRRNAQKSTGPRTDAGKRSSSGNATTHGVFANGAGPLWRGSDPPHAVSWAAVLSDLERALVNS
jgi:hypothetical protein